MARHIQDGSQLGLDGASKRRWATHVPALLEVPQLRSKLPKAHRNAADLKFSSAGATGLIFYELSLLLPRRKAEVERQDVPGGKQLRLRPSAEAATRFSAVETPRVAERKAPQRPLVAVA